MKDKLFGGTLLKIRLTVKNHRLGNNSLFYVYIFLIIIVIYAHCKKFKITETICKEKKLPVISPP